ncbi:hypothetical protein BGW36DRAFT_387188 [Talaromyces proteolyticus]|uniref:Zn(2)-C6 fungal-type domain-containing protein n=1 Tax=Talaromyces proteolyticus TaxID=1131652 RepID=A0AAD4KN31_9EURO|nr:uncharacterized protein BGW36DRAFT_387188 [Talaromyces proteolyticus]KAH8692207.1 hypothetical protein BGW36DRAFT_387188 [Talaromyces proteolyticus]
MLQAAQACDACRDRKKRCDKALPTCFECKRRGVVCLYSQEVEERGMIEYLRQRLKYVENAVTDEQAVMVTTPTETTQLVPLNMVFNMKKWYFPMLLHFRFHSMVPSIRELNQGSAAYKLRTAWVTGYLTDPAMFHGVMYAASANLDLINGDFNNPITTFHRVEAIRLVNKGLSKVEGGDDLPPAIIAATWALAHVARLKGDISEAHLHESGLAQMVLYLTLDFINVCQPPFFAQPRRSLLSTALESLFRRGSEKVQISADIISLLQIISDPNLGQPQRQDPHNQDLHSPSPHHDYEPILMLLWVERLASVQHRNYISESCCLAAIIYWRALSANIPFLSPENDKIVQEIQTALRHSDSETWMEEAPEMHLWVSYVAALAAADKAQRAWFVAKSKISVVVLSPNQTFHFQDGVSHLLWLSRYLRKRFLISR